MSRPAHLQPCAVLSLVLATSCLATLAAAQPRPSPAVTIDEAGLSVFRDRRVTGAFVLVDLADDRTVVVGPADAERRVTPASTFKIPNALIALETGVADGPGFRLPWDGVPRAMPDWNRDHDLTSAIRFSVVWYFREIARRIGAARMRRYVDAFDYGNRDLSGGLDRFWLESSLRISPREQAAFVARLARGSLPLRPETMAQVREMIVLERDPGRVLSGKTGSAIQHGRAIGWLAGTFEAGGARAAYATLVLGGRRDLERIRPLRLEITKALLERWRRGPGVDSPP